MDISLCETPLRESPHVDFCSFLRGRYTTRLRFMWIFAHSCAQWVSHVDGCFLHPALYPMWISTHSCAMDISQCLTLLSGYPHVNFCSFLRAGCHMWISVHSCTGCDPRGWTSHGFLLIPARSGCPMWIFVHSYAQWVDFRQFLFVSSHVDFCSFLRGA